MKMKMNVNVNEDENERTRTSSCRVTCVQPAESSEGSGRASTVDWVRVRSLEGSLKAGGGVGGAGGERRGSKEEETRRKVTMSAQLRTTRMGVMVRATVAAMLGGEPPSREEREGEEEGRDEVPVRGEGLTPPPPEGAEEVAEVGGNLAEEVGVGVETATTGVEEVSYLRRRLKG